MSNNLDLLFPCCQSQSTSVKSDNGVYDCFQSASSHLVLALAMGIIAGLAMAFIFYSVPKGSIAIHWVVVAGGSFALIMGIITYILLRCLLGKVPAGL